MHYRRHFPCCGKHYALSGILTSTSAAVSLEVENWDFLRLALCLTYYLGLLMITQEYDVFDVCCILSPCWKLCHYQALHRFSCNSIGRKGETSGYRKNRQGKRPGGTCPRGECPTPVSLSIWTLYGLCATKCLNASMFWVRTVEWRRCGHEADVSAGFGGRWASTELRRQRGVLRTVLRMSAARSHISAARSAIPPHSSAVVCRARRGQRVSVSK